MKKAALLFCIIFHVLLSSVIFISGASKVHFELSSENSSTINRFSAEIVSGEVDIEEVVQKNSVLLRYVPDGSFEEALNASIETQNSKLAILLIRNGVNSSVNHLEFLQKLIKTELYSVLECFLSLHKVGICHEVDQVSLIKIAIEANDLRVLSTIWKSDISKHLSSTDVVEISVHAVNLDRHLALDFIFNNVSRLVLKAVLRSIFKMSLSIDRFYILKRCAENGISFNVLGLEERLLVLQLCAEVGCEVTASTVLRLPNIKSVLESSIDSIDSPIQIAKRKHHELIFESFSALIN
jgi:sulfur transfer complex TusBCD TusB component (DsrH family)